ncbi:MAG: hypothetical protein RLZZ312_361 [Bacteroidota bacterium]
MNKSWERAQIDRLILKQEQKIAGLSQEIASDNQPQNT